MAQTHHDINGIGDISCAPIESFQWIAWTANSPAKVPSIFMIVDYSSYFAAGQDGKKLSNREGYLETMKDTSRKLTERDIPPYELRPRAECLRLLSVLDGLESHTLCRIHGPAMQRTR
jgi:hypothetical protein